jgi:predicted Zn finger-like uncharacterized protein
MLIVCPSCASEYTIDPAKLGADGRTLRCAICRDTWFVSSEGLAMPPPEPEPAPAEPQGATLLPPARPVPRRSPIVRRLAALAAALVALAALPFLQDGFGKGRALVGTLLSPPQASLAFRDIRPEIVGAEDMRILIVEGEIANHGDAEAVLLPLEFLVRNGNEQVLATWTEILGQPKLGPGETLRFASRLASPPADGRQVRVQFTKAAGIAVAAR